MFVPFPQVITVTSYSTAVLEVATIASFPYYTYESVYRMWVIGSGFYGIYFLFSFPMFFRIDEEAPKKTDARGVPDDNRFVYKYTLGNVFKDALAHGMGTTMLLDLWRITIGNINNVNADKGVSWIF